ncbi:putative bifunctional diguanylate cyclase/phosphodiesterase [Paenibacillus chitinolyticus]|uniref:putative bifunctional diguanylate cyclase/phosphodiesterase n=1 Tax=Paenibacillus chitinolyticus TaxID=79263 RepID=UPI00366D7BED
MKDHNPFTSLLSAFGILTLITASAFIAQNAYDLKILLPIAVMVIVFEMMPLKMPNGTYFSGVTIGFILSLFEMGFFASTFFLVLNTLTFFTLHSKPFYKIRWFRFFTTLGMYGVSMLAAWGMGVLTAEAPLFVKIVCVFLAFEGVNLLLRTGIMRSVTGAPFSADKIIYEARSIQIGILIASVVLYKMLKQPSYELFISEIAFTIIAVKIIHYFVSGYLKQIDIIEESNKRYKKMAYYDSVTGLPNRVHFNERLTQDIAVAQVTKGKVGLLFLDLDQFKNINDTMGHVSGDALLVQVAGRLQSCLGQDHTVSRLGGDEFTIIVRDIAGAQDCVLVAETVLSALKTGFFLQGKDIYITPSIGISLYPDNGYDSETIVKNADTAMYRAKELGGNLYSMFTSDLEETIEKKLILQRNLHKALERGEFHLVYQPQLQLDTGQIQGIEALVRWNNPELGLVSPEDFIPLAEESRQILSIGEWVLRTACGQNKAWQNEGFPPVRMAVNLSSIQFEHDELIPAIRRILDETGLEARWLELEITESLLLRNKIKTMRTLRQLKELGVHIAMDDFGVGYSSLSYLNYYPFDRLKIDKSFIQHMNERTGDEWIVRTVIQLAHGLHMTVVAEGVETEEQLAYLKIQSCDCIQGYLISKPLAPSLLQEKLWGGSGTPETRPD